MKNILYTLAAFMTMSLLISCEAEVDDTDVPALTLTPSDLNFTVTQAATNNNLVTLTNLTPGTISYWSYTDANGNELGHSNQNQTSVTFPFAGVYKVFFTAYAQGGTVVADPVTINVSENNNEYFSAPEWAMLTNGVEGKTWVLDMASPVGWGGLEFPYGDTSDADNYWNWYPDYASTSWIMPNKNWGEMTFDLNGAYNVSVTQTALTTDTQTTKTGSYSFDIVNHNIIFNGGVELLYGGDYYPDVSNWTSVKVIELTATSLRLAVLRNQSRIGEGQALIIFHYKPKA